MRFLITGATGTVGKALIKALSSNDTENQILTVNRSITKANTLFPYNNVTNISVEQLSEVEQFDPEIVYHLATLSTSRNDEEIIKSIIDSNILFGVKLLDVLRKCSALKLFVNVGTFAEYRSGINKVDNAYLYSATKTAFRQFVEYYSSLNNYKYIHVIPYTIYGGLDTSKKIMDHLYDSIAAQEPVKMTMGEQILDFIHLDDVVDFFITLGRSVDSIQNGENYYLGTGKGFSIKELSKLLEIRFNRKCNIEWGALPYRVKDVMYAVAPISLNNKNILFKTRMSIESFISNYKVK